MSPYHQHTGGVLHRRLRCGGRCQRPSCLSGQTIGRDWNACLQTACGLKNAAESRQGRSLYARCGPAHVAPPARLLVIRAPQLVCCTGGFWQPRQSTPRPGRGSSKTIGQASAECRVPGGSLRWVSSAVGAYIRGIAGSAPAARLGASSRNSEMLSTIANPGY